MAHREREEIEPPLVERARSLHVPLQHHAADRVWAVRHDDPLAATRRLAHQEHGGGRIAVVPGADVLQIDHNRIDAVQHGEVGRARRGVEAVNWKPGGRVHGVGEPRAVLRAAESVLGTEQRRHAMAAGDQALYVAAALTVDAGLVREQGQPLAGEQVRRVGQQDLDSRAHLSRGGRGTGEQPQQREMMRAHRLLVLAAVLGCAGAQAVGRTAASPLAAPRAPAPALVDSLLRSLTVRQRVGQLVVPRLSGAYAALDDSLFQVAARWVDSLEVGGLTVFAGSPFDVAAKLNALQRRARLPLLVSADLEWGAGMRLVGATAFPMVMAAGATGDPGDAYTIAAAAATEGRAGGIHVNFAPDADVNNNPANPIINTRSFVEDPRAVSRLVAEAVRGLRDHGMLATLKHFPGHGDTQIDSHIGLPRIAASYGRLDSLELVPFRAGISAGADVVMSAHIVVPDLTGPEQPATLAAAVLTGLLRDSLMPVVGSKRSQDAATAMAVRSLTLVRDIGGPLHTLRAKRSRFALVAYGDELNSFVGQRMLELLRQGGDTVDFFRLWPMSGTPSYDSARSVIARAPAVVFAANVRPISGRGTISLPDSLAQLMMATDTARPTVVVSLGSPCLLTQTPTVRSYLIAWSGVRASERAVALALLGKVPITGRLPISLPPAYRIGAGVIVPDAHP